MLFFMVFELLMVMLISSFIVVPCCRHKKKKYKLLKKPNVTDNGIFRMEKSLNSSIEDETANSTDNVSETESSAETAIFYVPPSVSKVSVAVQTDDQRGCSCSATNSKKSVHFSNVSASSLEPDTEPLPFGEIGFFPALAILDDGTGKVFEMTAAIVDASIEFKVSGNASETMRDSIEGAKLYLKDNQNVLKISYPEENKDIRVRISPADEVKKRGYSGGCAAAVAMLSLLKNKPATPGFTFVGDILPNGRVQMVGCPPSKMSAAKKRSITHVILPKGMEAGMKKTPNKEGLAYIFVGFFSEVIEMLFGPDKH